MKGAQLDPFASSLHRSHRACDKARHGRRAQGGSSAGSPGSDTGLSCAETSAACCASLASIDGATAKHRWRLSPFRMLPVRSHNVEAHGRKHEYCLRCMCCVRHCTYVWHMLFALQAHKLALQRQLLCSSNKATCILCTVHRQVRQLQDRRRLP